MSIHLKISDEYEITILIDSFYYIGYTTKGCNKHQICIYECPNENINKVILAYRGYKEIKKNVKTNEELLQNLSKLDNFHRIENYIVNISKIFCIFKETHNIIDSDDKINRMNPNSLSEYETPSDSEDSEEIGYVNIHIKFRVNQQDSAEDEILDIKTKNPQVYYELNEKIQNYNKSKITIESRLKNIEEILGFMPNGVDYEKAKNNFDSLKI